jgi:hypothetical protein
MCYITLCTVYSWPLLYVLCHFLFSSFFSCNLVVRFLSSWERDKEKRENCKRNMYYKTGLQIPFRYASFKLTFSCSTLVEWKYFCVCLQTHEELKYYFSYLKRFVYEFRVCNRSLHSQFIADVSECRLSFWEWAYADKPSYLICRLFNDNTSTSLKLMFTFEWRVMMVMYVELQGYMLEDGTAPFRHIRGRIRNFFDQDASTHRPNSNCYPAKYQSGTSFKVTCLVGTVDVLICYLYTCLLDIETHPSFILAL